MTAVTLAAALAALNTPADRLSARIEIGDGTYLAASSAATRVRGGGAAGGSGYVAVITGLDAARSFVDAHRRTSASGRSGSIAWVIPAEVSGRPVRVLEYRRLAESSSRTADGFALVLGNRVVPLTKAEAVSLVAAGIVGVDLREVDQLANSWERTVAGLVEAASALDIA